MTTNIQLNRQQEAYYDAIALGNQYVIDTEEATLFELMLHNLIHNSSSNFFKVTEKTTTEVEHALLDAYQSRVQVNADAWQVLEAEIMSDINTYEFEQKIEFKNPKLIEKGFSIRHTPIKIKAVIDWLDLSFEVDPTICGFTFKKNARSFIKSFLTAKTGTRHYVKLDESDIAQVGLSFTIRLHNLRSKDDLLKVTHLITTQYGADPLKMVVTNIELSLDFYNAPNRGLLSALHKSLKYITTADNFRIYKYMQGDSRNKLTPVPKSPLVLLKQFNCDWCMGINPKGAPLCYRLYPKTTDNNKQPLPNHEHRLRVEVTLNHEALKGIDNHLSNLTQIIKFGFRYLTFTKLNKDAPSKDKTDYREQIQPFGMEQENISKNRNKRTLLSTIKTHAKLNKIVGKAVSNLCRKF
ncbi:hypothetical protein [Acinetobacter johnsonii]|jgi:hypothetical protein|uniref:hypothetical protein n=1 Tax=Acinetobacter johnsonii TaxID=40214 RepID=UPI00103F6B6D|nr:hypothetical protein [Acinetobacter johnsonii]QBK71146.1 hypothetical protein E0Z08_17350 [Acinetobacter johnsonii]